MKKVELKDVKAYEAPGHFGMTAMRLQGQEETGIQKFWMGLSHFLPGGGAEWAYEDSPLEKVYFVLEGEMTVKSKTEEIVLSKWDSQASEYACCDQLPGVAYDGFVKSPSAALHFIFSHCSVHLCTPRSQRFARLASGAFYCAV
jgi:hypothetical protein